MKTYIIYLAAGNSCRFHENKLLYMYHGKPLYQHTFIQLIDHFDNIIVVTQYPEIKKYVNQYSHVHCLLNEQCKQGLSYSIKTALQFLKNVKRPFNMVFVVADQPNLKISSIHRLVTISHLHNARLASMKSRQRYGNPTLFHSDFYDELMQLSADQGGRIILKKHNKEVVSVDIDDDELYDIDEKNDL